MPLLSLPAVVLAVGAALPGTTASTAAPAAPAYVVRAGDTVSAIAVRNHTTVRAIVDANHLALGGHLVRPGQRLALPVSGAVARPSQTT